MWEKYPRTVYSGWVKLSGILEFGQNSKFTLSWQRSQDFGQNVELQTSFLCVRENSGTAIIKFAHHLFILVDEEETYYFSTFQPDTSTTYLVSIVSSSVTEK